MGRAGAVDRLPFSPACVGPADHGLHPWGRGVQACSPAQRTGHMQHMPHAPVQQAYCAHTSPPVYAFLPSSRARPQLLRRSQDHYMLMQGPCSMPIRSVTTAKASCLSSRARARAHTHKYTQQLTSTMIVPRHPPSTRCKVCGRCTRCASRSHCVRERERRGGVLMNSDAAHHARRDLILAAPRQRSRRDLVVPRVTMVDHGRAQWTRACAPRLTQL